MVNIKPSGDYKWDSESEYINKYLDNGNYHAVGMEYKDRYCKDKDYKQIEYLDYGNDEGKLEDKFLSLQHNFISEVEKQDLTELLVKLGERIDEEESYANQDDIMTKDPIVKLKSTLKSLARVVHRFNYTYSYHAPVESTMKSRKSVW